MEYSAIKYEKKDSVATITKLDFGITRPLLVEQTHALVDAKNDDSVRVVVIDCEMVHMGATLTQEWNFEYQTLEFRDINQQTHALGRLIETMEKPVIGVVRVGAE